MANIPSQPACPQCGSPTRLISVPLSRICTNNDCQFQAEPGEINCTHLDNKGDVDAVLVGHIREEAAWECNRCGELINGEAYGLPDPTEEWANIDADKADQLREWYA